MKVPPRGTPPGAAFEPEKKAEEPTSQRREPFFAPRRTDSFFGKSETKQPFFRAAITPRSPSEPTKASQSSEPAKANQGTNRTLDKELDPISLFRLSLDRAKGDATPVRSSAPVARVHKPTSTEPIRSLKAPPGGRGAQICRLAQAATWASAIGSFPMNYGLDAKLRERYFQEEQKTSPGLLPTSYDRLQPMLLVELLTKYVAPDGKFDAPAFASDFPDSAPAVMTMIAEAPPFSTHSFDANPRAIDALTEAIRTARFVMPDLCRQVIEGLPQIPKSLPAVDFIRAGEKGKPLENFVVLGVQHQLATQIPMFDALEKLGAKAQDIHLLGVPYSTSDLVSTYLELKGYDVDPGIDNNHGDFHEKREKKIRSMLSLILDDPNHGIVATGRKVLVLDDGGLVAGVVLKHFAQHAHLFHIVEQTTRGITELSRVPELPFPVTDIARSIGKERESPFIAQSVVRGLYSAMREQGMTLDSSVPITVVGYGRVGAAMAKLMRDLGMKITVVEKDPEKRAAASAAGFKTSPDVLSVAPTTQLLVGGTGHRSVSSEELEALPSGAVVASASSAEAEIEMEWLRSYGSPQPKRRRGSNEEFEVHGKTITVLRAGRPVNFDQTLENVPPAQIQLTRGLMLLGAITAAKKTERGISAPSEDRQKELLAFLERLWKLDGQGEPLESPKPTEFRSAEELISLPRSQAALAFPAFFESQKNFFPRDDEAREASPHVLFETHEGKYRLLSSIGYPREKAVCDFPDLGGKILDFRILDGNKVGRATVQGADGSSNLVDLDLSTVKMSEVAGTSTPPAILRSRPASSLVGRAKAGYDLSAPVLDVFRTGKEFQVEFPSQPEKSTKVTSQFPDSKSVQVMLLEPKGPEGGQKLVEVDRAGAGLAIHDLKTGERKRVLTPPDIATVRSVQPGGIHSNTDRLALTCTLKNGQDAVVLVDDTKGRASLYVPPEGSAVKAVQGGAGWTAVVRPPNAIDEEAYFKPISLSYNEKKPDASGTFDRIEGRDEVRERISIPEVISRFRALTPKTIEVKPPEADGWVDPDFLTLKLQCEAVGVSGPVPIGLQLFRDDLQKLRDDLRQIVTQSPPPAKKLPQQKEAGLSSDDLEWFFRTTRVQKTLVRETVDGFVGLSASVSIEGYARDSAGGGNHWLDFRLDAAQARQWLSVLDSALAKNAAE